MRPYAPYPEAARRLRRQLAACASAPHVEHDARAPIAAVACQWLDSPPAPGQLVPYDRLRLAVLTHRWDRRRGRTRARTPLATYAPALDLPGTGRVTFHLEAVADLRGRAALEPGGDLDPTCRFDCARLALQLALAAEDAEPYDLVAAPTLPRFYWAYRPGRDPAAPGGVAAEDWGAQRVFVGHLQAWPAVAFTAGGEPIPAHFWPDAVYAAIPDGLQPGRRTRNPAVAALRHMRLFRDRDWSYRNWLDSLTVRGDGGRRPRPLDGPGSPTARCRDAIAALALRRGDADFFPAVAAAAAAAGVPVPPHPDDVDMLAELASSPWQPAVIPDRWPIDPVGLAGPPGPATLTFAADDVVADLDQLPGSAAPARGAAR